MYRYIHRTYISDRQLKIKCFKNTFTKKGVTMSVPAKRKREQDNLDHSQIATD